ncbi:MAG: GGDEF domain-containing protein, partial [Vicinamibacterales bacterium]
INDTLGHEVGDVALIETANVMRQVFRGSDVMARLGGDEFVVLVSTGDAEALQAIFRRVRDVVDAFNGGARPFRLSISIGTAIFDGAAPVTVHELLAQADALMYEQKRNRPRL